MNKRAEERALEAYPSHVEIVSDVKGTQNDLRGFARDCYQEGYEQAEKDDALTWEDIKRIHEIANDVWDRYVDDSLVELELEPMKEQEYYEKILNRFNDERK